MRTPVMRTEFQCRDSFFEVFGVAQPFVYVHPKEHIPEIIVDVAPRRIGARCVGRVDAHRLDEPNCLFARASRGCCSIPCDERLQRHSVPPTVAVLAKRPRLALALERRGRMPQAAILSTRVPERSMVIKKVSLESGKCRSGAAGVGRSLRAATRVCSQENGEGGEERHNRHGEVLSGAPQLFEVST